MNPKQKAIEKAKLILTPKDKPTLLLTPKQPYIRKTKIYV